jgi:hypothetical protein
MFAKLTKKERHKIYLEAFKSIEEDWDTFICLAMDNCTEEDVFEYREFGEGEPTPLKEDFEEMYIMSPREWDGAGSFADYDNEMFWMIHDDRQEVRKIILLFCIEMTKN